MNTKPAPVSPMSSSFSFAVTDTSVISLTADRLLGAESVMAACPNAGAAALNVSATEAKAITKCM